MFIKQKLFRLKTNEGDNIVQHISTFRSLLNQIAGVNSKVDDDDAKAILLSSMPSSFDHIVFTLNKMNPSLETIVSSLIDEEVEPIRVIILPRIVPYFLEINLVFLAEEN